jgi:hypothetical protein
VAAAAFGETSRGKNVGSTNVICTKRTSPQFCVIVHCEARKKEMQKNFQRKTQFELFQKKTFSLLEIMTAKAQPPLQL